ncbi:unnamed protein product [Didymodactylos carnosus]|nr:unnamed protein product [Didymodactylos carnosus]CAF4452085.1 unnamed protein product [Didymodactylos carnosus]
MDMSYATKSLLTTQQQITTVNDLQNEMAWPVKTFIPKQNYPNRYLGRLATTPIKQAEIKYPSHIFLSQ